MHHLLAQKRIPKTIGCLVLICCCHSTAVATQPLQQLIDTNIYLAATHHQARQALITSCPATTITTAHAKSTQIQEMLTRILNQQNDYQTRTRSKQLYIQLQKILAKTNTMDSNKRCTLQYIIITLLADLKQQHLDIMKNTGIDADFQNVADTGQIEGVSFKKALLQETLKRYLDNHTRNTAKTLPVQGNTNLSLNEQLLQPTLTQLTKLIIVETLHGLQRDQRLTPSDVQTLLDKTAIHYHPNTCGSHHGHVQVSITKDHTGTIIEQKLIEFTISLNGCFNIFNLEHIHDTIQQITVHEAAHYLDYFQDDNNDRFYQLCRSNKTTRNTRCQNDDFVSQYAQTSAAEDYAETFTAHYLNTINTNNTIITQKQEHFSSLHNTLIQ